MRISAFGLLPPQVITPITAARLVPGISPSHKPVDKRGLNASLATDIRRGRFGGDKNSPLEDDLPDNIFGRCRASAPAAGSQGFSFMCVMAKRNAWTLASMQPSSAYQPEPQQGRKVSGAGMSVAALLRSAELHPLIGRPVVWWIL
jgi:hypothetical protein